MSKPIGTVTERGERNCQTCGKPHNAVVIEEGFAGNWQDPDDGHPYRPESWESIARRLLAEKA